MNGIELPQETSFRLIGLTVTRSMDWKPYIQLLPRLLHGVGTLNIAQLICKPCHTGGMLSASACPYKYYYGKCSSELEDLVPPKRITVRSTRLSMHRHTANSPMRGTKFLSIKLFPSHDSTLERPH